MKIIVCIKQVPKVEKVKIHPKTKTLMREGVPSMINPMDRNGIQLASDIKKQYGGETIAISMGPPQAEEALREALAMGIDKGYLLSDKAFAGADTLATSHTLALGIQYILKESEKKEDYLVICGNQSIDGDTGQVGPELGEELGIPEITYVKEFQLQKNKIVVHREFRPEEEVEIETTLPALISVLKEINEPKYPRMDGIVNAYKKDIVYLDHNDINAKEENVGLKGSKTEMWEVFTPERKGDHLIFEGSTKNQVDQVCEKLKEDKII